VAQSQVGTSFPQYDREFSRLARVESVAAGEDVRVRSLPLPQEAEPRQQPAPAVQPRRRLRPSFELPIAVTVALPVGLAAGLSPMVAVVVIAVWAAAAYHARASLHAPGTSRWRGLVAAASPPVAAAGLAVGVFGAPIATTKGAGLMVVAATLAVLIRRAVRRPGPVRAVIMGDRAGIDNSARRWSGGTQVQIVGACLVDDAPVVGLPRSLSEAPLVVGPEELAALVDETTPDVVLVTPGAAATPARVRHAAWLLEKRPVGLALLGALDTVAPHRVSVTSYAGATLVHVAPSRPARVIRLLKDCLDRLFGAVLLVAAAPLLAILALVIRLESPGPAFFRQDRAGHHGRLFTMYKLRTMCDGAERMRAELADGNEADGLLFKMPADPRITRIGRFLRRSSLDELPQLINVLRGDMSIIGPRPALPDEVAAYDETTWRRLAVKPGITGLWQVSGRSDLPWDEAVRLDLHYTDNWRVRDDALIVLRTAGAVLSSRGAY